MKDFRDKTVVITGAGSGMGRAYALEFAKLGARLALNDYDAQGLDGTLALLKDVPSLRTVRGVFDVSDRAAMERFADEVKATLGNAHVVINNAGIEGSGRPTWATPLAGYERVMRINFYGVLHGSQVFLPQLLANGEGALVNVSSIFGLIGTPSNSDYCASKFAVRGFTEALMVELHDSPVSVHLVHPGGIATNIAMAGKVDPIMEQVTGLSEEKQKRRANKAISTTTAESAALQILAAVERNERRVLVGYDAKLLDKLVRLIGASYQALIVRQFRKMNKPRQGAQKSAA